MLRVHSHDNKYKRPRIFSKFPSKELDEILKDRLPKHWFNDEKSPYIVGEDKSMFGGDPFNRLQDEILLSIMSSLTIKEAASMAMVSRRWRYLWRESLILDFDIMSIRQKYVPFYNPLSKDVHEELKFVSWINQVLHVHSGERLQSFRIRYFLGERYNHAISEWIDFAIQKKVQNLTLDLSCPVYRPFILDRYTFPFWKFSRGGKGSPFLKHLSVSSCQMGRCSDFSGLKFLTSISLEHLVISQHDISSIFLNCLSLQCFSVKRCGCPWAMKFPGCCNQLKQLNLYECFCLEKIEIHCTNLASLECDAEVLEKSNMGKISQLQRLCFIDYCCSLSGVSYMLDGPASDFTQLETLFLSAPRIKEDMIPKQLPTFTKLKHMVFIGCGRSQESLFRLTTILLEASPFLHKLELHLNPIKEGEMLKTIPVVSEDHYNHKCLEIVEIYGFHGYQTEVDLAAFLLESAVGLRTMKIDRTERVYDGNGEWMIVNKPKEIKRSKIRRLLCREVPFTGKLIIL